jgi:hypothetical protein
VGSDDDDGQASEQPVEAPTESPLAQEPCRHELAVAAHRDVGPDIADAELVLSVIRNLLRLAMNERPNLVRLQGRAVEADHRSVHVVGARLAQVHEKLHDGVLRDTGDSAGPSDRHALGQTADHLGSTLRAEPVHRVTTVVISMVETTGIEPAWECLAKRLGAVLPRS